MTCDHQVPAPDHQLNEDWEDDKEILTCLVARVGDDVQCSITQPSVITTTTSEEANVQATDELCELPSCDVTVLDDPSPNSHQSSRCFHRLLVVGDNLLMFFIFGPIVIIFWTGVWSLLDLYVLPGDLYMGSWLSFIVGILLRMLLIVLDPTITKIYNRLGARITRFLWKNIFNFVSGCVMLSQWRGLWNVLDSHTGEGLRNNLVGFAIFAGVLVITESLNASWDVPTCLIVDDRKDYFICWPRFGSKRNDGLCRFLLDHIISLLVCDSAAIGLWQALWNLWYQVVDDPEDPRQLAVILALGSAILVSLCTLQVPATHVSCLLARYHWFLSLAWVDLYRLLVVVGQLGYWVGVWDLYVLYFLPGHELLAAIISLFASFIVMVLLRFSSQVANPGIDRDRYNDLTWETDFIVRRTRKTKNDKQILENMAHG